jgi:hypothetical protein
MNESTFVGGQSGYCVWTSACVIVLANSCSIVRAAPPCVDWQQRAMEARAGSVMAYDSARGVTVLYGGSSQGHIHDTWEWDGSKWRLATVDGRLWNSGGAMVYDSKRNVSVFYAAHETWEWDGKKWMLRTTDGPQCVTHGHCMAYDSVRGETILFGGYQLGGGCESTDTWSWDGKSWKLRSTTGPSARTGFAMTFDSVRGVVVLYGRTTNGVHGFSDT